MFEDYKYYCYEMLLKDISYISDKFYIKITSIGESVLGKIIPMIIIGNGQKKIFINAGHHALEWITCPLLVQFVYDTLKSVKEKKRLATYNTKELLEKATFYIVPMVNPDGIEITTKGISKSDKLYSILTKYNNGKIFSNKWQSNINGVDLNHNYDAGFYESFLNDDIPKAPSGTKYPGIYPESEPEVKAICDLCRKVDFDLAIAYHTQGEVIYYDYNNIIPYNSYNIVKLLCGESGYLPDKTSGTASFGGFKDWFIKEFNKPAYTIEAGLGKNPLSMYQFEDIYNKNLPMILLSGFLA